jgi:N-acetylglucosaminyldiphosphoundecaprenol N-acetyl-beta-D-mannosaminyltransferase
MKQSFQADVLSYDAIDVDGIRFDFLNPHQVMQAVERWRHRGESHYIAITNPHSVMTCHRDEGMRDATHGASLVLPDGVGVTLAARCMGHGKRKRLTGPDLMLKMCDFGRVYGHRHYFYGGAEGVADQLAERLLQRFPGMKIAGACCPPFRKLTPAEDARMVQMVNDARPDVIWVGLGAPKQEKWMHEHRDSFNASVMVGVGAAFDFHSGHVKWAPPLVRTLGLEWAHRLAVSPRRMWRRNMDSPLFMGRVMRRAVADGALRVIGRGRSRITRVEIGAGSQSLGRIENTTRDAA